MSDVQLIEISKSFGAIELLRHLSLDIQSGEYLVLLGPSGCGKTTTLRIIAGLTQPEAGQVVLGGCDMRGVAARNRDVVMVFQHDSLYPHWTIRQSLAFSLRRRRLGQSRPSREEVQQRILRAAEMVEVSELLDRRPARLSGGELRRAAIAKMLVRQAGVRLLDEPLSALDVGSRHRLQEDLRRMHRATAGTTVHVTHDGEEAMRMADRIAVMHEGSIVQVGRPETLYRQPDHRAVALALGSPPPSLLPVLIDQAGAQPVAADLAVRPLDWQIEIGQADDHRPPQSAAPLKMTPRHIELVGRVSHRWCRGPAEQLQAEVAGHIVTCVAPAVDGLPAAGETCRLRAAREAVLVFDRFSGRRLSGQQVSGIEPHAGTTTRGDVR